MEISGFEVFKEKVEKSIGRSISISELMVAMDNPGIIDSVVRQIVSIGRKIDKRSCLNIDGWTVRLSLDRYYRMYKTIEGEDRKYLSRQKSGFQKSQAQNNEKGKRA